MDYAMLKTVHIISATLLFGTGLGSAFYKWRADREGNLAAIAFASKNVVMADWLFTLPAVIIQPVTGLLMVDAGGLPLTNAWLLTSLGLYFLAGLCWIPVVWLQIRMRDIAVRALEEGTQLSDEYRRHARTWFWLGVPAFFSIVIVFHLMVFKPGQLS